MQSVQLVRPGESVYLPAGQRSQVALPEVLLKVPGKHGDGCGEPTEHAVPAGQKMHSSRLDMKGRDASE